MIRLIIGLVLALLMILATILDKAYQHTPQKELKRQARAGDPMAKALYKSAAYGLNARLLLGTIVVASASLSFVLLAKSLNSWAGFMVVALLIWFDFLWLASTRLTKTGAKIGATFAKPVAITLHYLHPLLEKISRLAHAYYPFRAGTGLYEPSDIVELLDWQKHQPDNRILEVQLDQAKQSLTFADKLVRDIVTPVSKVQTAKADDTIGPVLIDELTKSGQTLFPVFEGKNSHIIGSLNLSEVLNAAQTGGKISDIMNQKVFYVNEDFSLNQALRAFIKTKQDLLVVVNDFEDFAGVITIQDILTQLVSQSAKDKFEAYDNAKAVAESTNQVEEEPAAEPETTTPDEPVVELETDPAE